MTDLFVTCEDISEIEAYAHAGADSLLFALDGHIAGALRPLTEKETGKAFRACRKEGVKTGILLNRLYRQDELAELKTTLERLNEAGADTLWFADPAVYQLASVEIRRKLVYMPDMLLTDKEDARFWMEKSIFSTVISPLLTFAEMLDTVSAVKGLTAFIHGHFPLSYSRRLLLSSVEEGLIGKRNITLKEETRNEFMPAFENENGTVIYSPYALCSFEQMPRFMQSGLRRFLISSVYQSASETVDAVKTYADIMNGTDAVKAAQAYKHAHPETILTKGFYDNPTVR